MKRIRRYLQLAAMAAALIALDCGALLQTAYAAGGQIYVSPGSSGVQNQSNTTVSVRLNTGGASVDGVNVTLMYDASKLNVLSVSAGGSPIASGANYANSGGTISGGAYTTAPVNGDVLLFNVTFKALTGSGSAALQFSTAGVYGTEADSGGASIGAALVGGSVSFSQPTCAAGQTGIWPNCVTPTPPPSGGGTGGGSTGGGTSAGGTSSGSKSSGSTSKSSGGSSSGSTSSGGSSPAPAPSSDDSLTPVIRAQTVQFTKAKITTTSSTPTQVYLKYGTARNVLNFKTPLSSLGTTHEITFDDKALTPGQTYYYVVVAQDQQGKVGQSAVQSFTTKGITVNVAVADSNHNPIANQAVTLHSTPRQATTNAKGIATFSNVAPGSHHLSYTSGGKTYSQSLSVDNTIKTAADGTETATPQNISIVLPLSQHSSSPVLWTVLALVILAGAAVVLVVFRKRSSFAPAAAAHVVVGKAPQPRDVDLHGVAHAASDPLSHIAAPEKPRPGATISPNASASVLREKNG